MIYVSQIIKMNFYKLPQKYRKTEPDSVTTLRSFITLVIFVLLICYTIKLSTDVVNDIPTIETSYDNVSYIPIPGNLESFLYYFVHFECYYINIFIILYRSYIYIRL